LQYKLLDWLKTIEAATHFFGVGPLAATAKHRPAMDQRYCCTTMFIARKAGACWYALKQNLLEINEILQALIKPD
jgi:hypothetical protein